MLNLVSYNLPILGIALLIGIATARWAFRGPRDPAPDGEAEDISQT